MPDPSSATMPDFPRTHLAMKTSLSFSPSPWMIIMTIKEHFRNIDSSTVFLILLYLVEFRGAEF